MKIQQHIQQKKEKNYPATVSAFQHDFQVEKKKSANKKNNKMVDENITIQGICHKRKKQISK